MVVRLRLSRQGTRNNPFYHLVAIADHKPRDARPIEKLGEYDPIPRRIPILPKPSSSSSSSSSPSSSSSSSLSTSSNDSSVKGKNSQGKSSPKTGNGVITSGLPTGFRLEKRLEWDQSRIKHWLQKGAQPSRPVARLLDRAGLVPPNVFYKGMFRPPTTTSSGASSSTTTSSSVVKPSTTPMKQRTVSPQAVLNATNSKSSNLDQVGRESQKTMDQAS